jgi:hypothetical protein
MYLSVTRSGHRNLRTGTTMTTQQRDLVHQILRDAPFDLGGEISVNRPMLEQMLTA